MPIVCYERYKSVSGTLGESFSVGYVVQGTRDSALAISAVLSQSPPAVVSGAVVLNRKPLQITEEGNGTGIWHVDADYEPAGSEEDDEDDDDQATPLAFKLSWDTSGGTAKITESIEVVDGSGLAPQNNVIGWDGKKVNGCEIPAPALAITCDVFYAPQVITKEQVAFWSRSTGKVSQNDWFGWKAGELLLFGNTGEQTFSMLNGRSTKPAPVSFKIHFSENIPQFTIKGDPDLAANGGKQGWDYLDVFYGEKTVAGQTVATPLWFKIHRVLPRISFQSVMGIG